MPILQSFGVAFDIDPTSNCKGSSMHDFSWIYKIVFQRINENIGISTDNIIEMNVNNNMLLHM